MIADRLDLSGLASADNPNSPLPSQTRLVIPEAVERQRTDLCFFEGKVGKRGKGAKVKRVRGSSMTVWRLERSLALRLPRARARSSSPLLVSLAGPPRPPSGFLGAGNVAPKIGQFFGWIESIEKPRSIQGGELGSARAGHGDEELGMVMVMRSEGR